MSLKMADFSFDVSSYTALFANWQIVDTYINLLLMSTSIARHFCCVPFPKLDNEPCRYPISKFGNLGVNKFSFLMSFHESALYIS